MPTSEDLSQQRDIGKAFREISDLRGDVKELRTALVGIDGRNGLRRELRAYMEESREHMAKLDEMIKGAYEWQAETEQRFRHYIDVERKETCYGADLLDEYKKEQEAIKKDSLERRRHADTLVMELEKQKIATRGVMIAAVIAALASLATAIIK
jgi:hypothetical protein